MNLIHSGKIDYFSSLLERNQIFEFPADRSLGLHADNLAIKNLYLMQDIHNRIQQMNIDYVEYFHLKLLLLCRWGK